MRIANYRLEIPGLLLWMAAWTIVGMQYTTWPGAIASAAGALLGFVAAKSLARHNPRLAAVMTGCGMAWLLILMVSAALRHWPVFSTLAGQASASQLAEVLLWGGTTFCLSLALDLLRFALPEAGFVRAAFVIASLAALFAAHRDGAQQRPYAVVDSMLIKGYDPIDFFILMGVAAALSVVVFGLVSSRLSKRDYKNPMLLTGLVLLLLFLLPAALPRLILRAQAGGPNGAGQGQRSKPQKGDNQGSGQAQNQGGGNGSGTANGPKGNRSGASSNSDGQSQDPDLSVNNNPDSPRPPLPVAVVTFHDDYDPPSRYYYFRQSVLTLLNHDQLIADTAPRYAQGMADGFPVRRTPVAGDIPDHAQLVRMNIALLAPHSRPFGLVTPVSYSPAANPDPKRFERAYHVDSMALNSAYTDLLRLPVASPLPSDGLALKYFTDAPNDPRFAGIVNEALAKLPPAARPFPLARAWAIKSWLDAHVTYNTRASHAQADDPVADFLFGDRNGYCVHFAQAAALLYRTAGVPARVSQGYAVASRQRGHGSSLLIRSVDAHAWPEIYLQGAGWTALDINPQHVATPPQEPVDPEQQRMLGEMARQNPAQMQAPDEGGQSKGGKGRGSRARSGLLALLCALVLRQYLRKFWLQIAIYLCPAADLPRVALRAALASLADAGLVRRTGSTREQFARTLFPAVPSLEVLTRLHVQASLGSLSPSVARRQYLDLCHNIGRQVRYINPGWRRVLGWLDPRTAWRVH